MQEVKKIVILGPESTGKSTLCELLSQHYKTVWCPEYAREYLEKNGTNYTYDDLLAIAKGQLVLEEEYVNKARFSSMFQTKHPILFVDTDMYVMKVWCEFVFNQCHPFILEKIIEQKSELYLLCNIDLPWVKDELREYPDIEKRKELYNIYKDILINQTTPWVEVAGSYEERLKIAIAAVDGLVIS